MLEPKEGLLTFRAEGNNIAGSRYYSRKIHWPGMAAECKSYGSGVTIGRGYDMKYRSASEIIAHLTLAGVPLDKAKKIAQGAKKSHCNASEFVRNNKSATGEITEAQQLRLFEVVYHEYLMDSIRFYSKYKRNNAVSWDKLHPVLKDVFVDMKYQGVLASSMISVFGLNSKEPVIKLISQSPYLMSFEQARGRIDYIKKGMK